jgi:hypothetical protein
MLVDDLFNKKTMTESRLNEIDPRNYDSDEDYYNDLHGDEGEDEDDVDPPEDDWYDDADEPESHYEKSLRVRGLGEDEQLDELSFKDIQRGANKFAKGANKFTKNVADTGAAVGNAAGALGGAIKQVGKTTIADPLSATYNATKSGLNKAAGVAANTYNDVKAGTKKVGGAVDTIAKDVGDAGTWAGDKIKQAGRGVANVAGGTAGALGSVVGGATTGAGRAAAKGFNTGVKNVGGNAVNKLQTNIMTPKSKPAEIQQQIELKQDEIKQLQTQLTTALKAGKSGQSGIQTGATALIDPDTNKPYEKEKLAAKWAEKPAAQAAAAPIPQATTPGAPASITYNNVPGINKTKPAAQKAPSYGTNFGGYNYAPLPKSTATSPAAAPAAAPAAQEPITIGGQKIKPSDPTYNKIMKGNLAMSETVNKVTAMLENVRTRSDVRRIQNYIDIQCRKHGISESTQREFVKSVTHVAALRRREHSSLL